MAARVVIPLESEKLFAIQSQGLQDEVLASELLTIARDQYHAEFEYWNQQQLTDKGKEWSFKRLDIWAKIGDACAEIRNSERKIRALLSMLSDMEEEIDE